MNKIIIAAQILPNTAHPAVGSKVKLIFNDGTTEVAYEDTLLGKYGNFILLTSLIGKVW